MSRKGRKKNKNPAPQQPQEAVVPAAAAQTEAAAPAAEKKFFLKFLAFACALTLLVLCRPLFNGGIALYLSHPLTMAPWSSVQEYRQGYERMRARPFGEGVTFSWDAESLYYPFLHYAASELSAGRLPLWLPFAGCGTPLIANQQSAVFNPLFILYYLTKSIYVYNVVAVFRLLIVGVFGFLFARRVGLSRLAAAYAGALVMVCPSLYGIWSHPHGTAISFIMPLLWVSEKFRVERSVRARLDLAAVVAIAVTFGAPEVSFTTFMAAGLYMIARAVLAADAPPLDRAKRVGVFALTAASGGLMAAGHLLPAQEYIALSYANAWRSGKGFSWEIMAHYARPFRGADIFPFAAALACGFFAWKSFVTMRKRWDDAKPLEKSIQAAFTTGLAALSLGIFLLLGMDERFVLTPFTVEMPIGRMSLGGVAVFVLALFALVRRGPAPAQRALAWTIFVLALLCFKVFGFGHVAGHLPFLKIATAEYPIFPIPFLLIFISAFGVDRLLESAGWPVARRVREARLFALAAFLLPVGVWAAFQFKLAAVDNINIGLHPRAEIRDKDGRLHGGLMGAGKIRGVAVPATIRGWVSSDLPVAAVYAGFPPDNLAPAKLTPSGGRLYFRRRTTGESDKPMTAVVVLRDKKQITLSGSPAKYAAFPPWHVHAALYAAAAALLLAGLFFPACVPWAAAGAGLLALAQMTIFAFARIPYTDKELVVPRVPHIAILEKDKSLFRTGSLEHERIWRPASNLLYGISDFRNSDAIDVMRWVHFERAVKSLAQSEKQRDREQAYALFDLANVKYLYSSSTGALASPHYEVVYQHRDFVLNRSRSVLPRARLYYDAVSIPDSGLDDNVKGQETLGQFMGWMADPKNDIRGTLILHDAPGVARSALPPEPAEIVSYESNRAEFKANPRQTGYLFLADTYFPGWKAAVDGKPREILKAMIGFRAVRVEPGESSVVFTYAPKRFVLGACIAASACLVWLYFWVGAVWKRPRGGEQFLLGERICEGLLLWTVGFWTLWSLYGFL